MRPLIPIIAGIVACCWMAHADDLDPLTVEAQQRIHDRDTGQDMVRAQQAHQAGAMGGNGLWARAGNSSDWYSSLRIIKVHLQESIQHLQASVDWVSSMGELFDAQDKPVVFQSTRSGRGGSLGGMYRDYSCNISGYTINKSYFEPYNGSSAYISYADSQHAYYPYMVYPISQEVNAAQSLKEGVFYVWRSQANTDPSGRMIASDWTALAQAVPDVSPGTLQSANQSTPPDRNVFNIVGSDTSGNVTHVEDLARGNNSVTVDQLQSSLSTTDLQAVKNNVAAAGIALPATAAKYFRNEAVWPPAAASWNNPQTNLENLRKKVVLELYKDLASGAWGSGQYRFTRPVRRSSTYTTALTAYSQEATKMIGYYQRLMNAIEEQLKEADDRDKELISMVEAHREERAKQIPLKEIISASDARQLLDIATGNRLLSSIPLIPPSAYTPWLAGPPWAHTPCFNCSPMGYVPNPLYHTITAQLVRGLFVTQGQEFTGVKAATAELKTKSQTDEAIRWIQDLYTKIEDLKMKEAEYAALGNNSQVVQFNSAGDSTKGQLKVLDQASDAIAGAALTNASLINQQAVYIQKRNEELRTTALENLTLEERAGLRNAQELEKLQAVDSLGAAIGNRNSLRAASRNDRDAKEREQQTIRKAIQCIPME